MDTTVIIGLVVVLIVGFFGFQWWSASQRRAAAATASAKKMEALLAATTQAAVAPMKQVVKEETLPAVTGQTEADLKAKEPAQRPVPATQQMPVTYEGDAPAQFKDNLRRPEQSFHQPAAAPAPTLQISDVPSGRAATGSTPLGGHQQSFVPEMAQNGGALIGNSVFAYDGMEPTDFSAF